MRFWVKNKNRKIFLPHRDLYHGPQEPRASMLQMWYNFILKSSIVVKLSKTAQISDFISMCSPFKIKPVSALKGLGKPKGTKSLNERSRLLSVYITVLQTHRKIKEEFYCILSKLCECLRVGVSNRERVRVFKRGGEKEREREWQAEVERERERVCVCERESAWERERVCMCLWEREIQYVWKYIKDLRIYLWLSVKKRRSSKVKR